jgi:hypothetical protein
MNLCLTLLLKSLKRTVRRVVGAVLGQLASPARTCLDVASIPVQSGIPDLSLCCWRQIVRTTEDIFLWVLQDLGLDILL